MSIYSLEGLDFKLPRVFWPLFWRSFLGVLLLVLAVLILVLVPGSVFDENFWLASISVVFMFAFGFAGCILISSSIDDTSDARRKAALRYASERVDEFEMFFGVTFLAPDELDDRYRRLNSPVEALAFSATGDVRSSSIFFRPIDNTISLTEQEIRLGSVKVRDGKWVLYEMVDGYDVPVKAFKY